MKNKKYFYLSISLLALFCLFSGIFIGRMWQIQGLMTGDNGEVKITKVLDLYSQSRTPEVEFTEFWDLWDKIKTRYVGQPVDEVNLFYGAMQGLVSGLGDPYSIFFPPKEARQFAKDLSGEAFDGIGAEIGLRKDQLTVIAPLKGSPAEKAGLRAGDKIYAIDGVETFDMNLDEAVNNIRGKKGTEVKLTISHDGLDGLEDIVVVRDTISLPTVEWEMKDNNIVYLHISYFNDDTWGDFDKAVSEVLLASPKGIILDLRSNPGGYFDTSVAVASEWIPAGVVVKEKFSETQVSEYESSGKHRLADLPTVILIDEGTASGSEIVAGALQDYKLATLVGQTSYGKGSVQEFEILPDGSALKLTVARWYTPKDRQIDKEGIKPDVELEEMFTDVVVDEETGEVNYRDLGIEKALELLSK